MYHLNFKRIAYIRNCFDAGPWDDVGNRLDHPLDLAKNPENSGLFIVTFFLSVSGRIREGFIAVQRGDSF